VEGNIDRVPQGVGQYGKDENHVGCAEQQPQRLSTQDTPAPQPGNPNTKVWVDVHTALYYCPGADLYGKTADGKYTSQLDAQRDNFRPSTLKACD